VSKVRITCLVANTYFARIHFSRGRKSQEGVCHEIDVDARPSDAINMAVRFDAPVYVHKQVANRMACQPEKFRPPTTQTTSEITRSCKDLLMHFPDPTVVDKLHLQLAIVEERYDDALK
jgi:bifunctional DNase/RNase